MANKKNIKHVVYSEGIKIYADEHAEYTAEEIIKIGDIAVLLSNMSDEEKQENGGMDK